MAHNFTEEIKKQIETSLPTSAGMVARIVKVIYDPATAAKDIADVIEHDPPLTAKILKVTNSAYYGLNSQVTSLQRAVVVLGFDTVKEIVSTVSIVDTIQQVDGASQADMKGLWNHSVGTAKACQLIADNTKLARPEVAYIVGLLHDIGKIILATVFPDNFNMVLKMVQEKNCRILLAERRILNTDHTMIGKILCDIWGLPDDISTAILYHHDPMSVSKGSQALARIAEIGDYMCRKAQIGFPGDTNTQKPSAASLAILGTKPGQANTVFMELFKKLVDQKDDIESFFSTLEDEKPPLESL